jgi:hypothetical protein
MYCALDARSTEYSQRPFISTLRVAALMTANPSSVQHRGSTAALRGLRDSC